MKIYKIIRLPKTIKSFFFSKFFGYRDYKDYELARSIKPYMSKDMYKRLKERLNDYEN